MNGIEVACALKLDPALRLIPLVAVSDPAGDQDRERILEAGFDGHLSTPIEPVAFIGEVERFLPEGRHKIPVGRASHEADGDPGTRQDP